MLDPPLSLLQTEVFSAFVSIFRQTFSGERISNLQLYHGIGPQHPDVPHLLCHRLNFLPNFPRQNYLPVCYDRDLSGLVLHSDYLTSGERQRQLLLRGIYGQGCVHNLTQIGMNNIVSHTDVSKTPTPSILTWILSISVYLFHRCGCGIE